MTDLAEIVKLVSELGPTGAWVILFVWFARWLPKHLKEQLEFFRTEMATERARCDRAIQDQRDDANEYRLEVLRAIRDLKP